MSDQLYEFHKAKRCGFTNPDPIAGGNCLDGSRDSHDSAYEDCLEAVREVDKSFPNVYEVVTRPSCERALVDETSRD
jgi:hypothetical protein